MNNIVKLLFYHLGVSFVCLFFNFSLNMDLITSEKIEPVVLIALLWQAKFKVYVHFCLCFQLLLLYFLYSVFIYFKY